MSKQAFRVEGDFQMGRNRQHFQLEVIGLDDAAAREATYAEIGSRHGTPRRLIDLTTVTALKTADASPITQKRLQA